MKLNSIVIMVMIADISSLSFVFIAVTEKANVKNSKEKKFIANEAAYSEAFSMVIYNKSLIINNYNISFLLLIQDQ